MDNSSIDAGSRFLASTLHEIRTPIQTIISTIELMQDTPLNKEQTEYVHQIEFSANVLLQLANDVLDFTKIKSKEFKLENIPFDVGSLTEKVVDLVSIEAFNHKIEIITDIDAAVPKSIMGDPTRIQQIILNLIKNAVKFTSQGYILVRVRANHKQILFEVIDSGIGVAPEKQEMIFKDFYQVDASTTRKYGGTGLGLSICKNLVTVMKGKIGVKSNPSGGSIFWFTIPLEKAEEPFTEVKLDFPKNTRILIIDDNEIACLSMKRKLERLGIKDIDSASNESQAMEKAKKATADGKPYTIAFIDMIMPKMDGWRLASEINNNPQITRLSLYMMIPEGQMRKDAKMKLLGWFRGYLYKPVKYESLRNLLIEEFATPEELSTLEFKTQKPSPIPAMDDSLIGKGIKILIAEDHPVNRKLMNSFLEKFGATVFLAENGLEAVEQIQKHPEIDLIFMDIQMPVKNGTDATIELRSKDFKGIIVACTANNNQTDIEAYKRLGINDVLVKPFKRDAIKQILEKWNTVLSVPEAKEILSLADINISASKVWDAGDFLDTVAGNTNLAIEVLDDYIEQTNNLLVQIKQELSKASIDFSVLQVASHTLKGSSGSVSAVQLSDYGKQMEDAAKAKDSITLESARTNFAIDFLEFKKLYKQWKKSLD